MMRVSPVRYFLQFYLVVLVLNLILHVDCAEQRNCSETPIFHRAMKRIYSRSDHFEAVDIDFENNPFTLVLIKLIEALKSEYKQSCHIIVYYNEERVSSDQLLEFKKLIGIPIIYIDVNKSKFPLLTVSKYNTKSNLVKLLEHREEPERCRFLIAWSTIEFQKGLLLLTRSEPSILKPQDTIIFPTYDKSLDRFMPQIKSRIIVRKISKPTRKCKNPRSHRFLKFVIEKGCDWCKTFKLLRIGEYVSIDDAMGNSKLVLKSTINGSNLMVAYTNSVPNIFPIQGTSTVQMEGLEMRMLEYTAKYYNFTFKLYEPNDKEWGRKINGSWSGKVGEVVRKNADLAIGGIVLSLKRREVTEYSVFFNQELWGIVCPHPSRIPLWPYVMFPFSGQYATYVFYLLVILYIVVFLVSSVVEAHDLTNEAENQIVRFRIYSSVYNVIRVGLSYSLLFLTCLYLWNLYFCIIKPNLETSINTVEDLLISKKKFAIVKGTSVKDVFASSPKHSYKSVTSLAKYINTITEGWQLIDEQGICLVGIPKRYAKASIKTRYTTKCGESAIVIGKENLHTVSTGWLTPYGSTLGKKVNNVIRRLESFGLMKKWQEELYEMLSKESEKLPCLFKPVSPLTLGDLRLVFVFLLLGYVASFITFCLERLIARWKSKYSSKWAHKLVIKTPLVKTIEQYFDKPKKIQHSEDREELFRHALENVLQDIYPKSSVTQVPRSRSMIELSAVNSSNPEINPKAIVNEEDSTDRCYDSESIHSESMLNKCRSKTAELFEMNKNPFHIMVKPVTSRLSRASRVFPPRKTAKNPRSFRRFSPDLPRNTITTFHSPNVPVAKLTPLEDSSVKWYNAYSNWEKKKRKKASKNVKSKRRSSDK